MKSSTFVYEETPLIELLVLSSFIYLLNAFGSGLEKLLHAGLIAQIGVGIVYGPPLGNIFPQNWLGSLQALGNLGLILLVFQGMRYYSILDVVDCLRRWFVYKARPLKSKHSFVDNSCSGRNLGAYRSILDLLCLRFWGHAPPRLHCGRSVMLNIAGYNFCDSFVSPNVSESAQYEDWSGTLVGSNY